MELIFALKCSLIITAIYASTWDGMVFGKIRAKIDSISNNPLYQELLKPLYGCVICMASIWGSLIYILMYGFSINIFAHILLVAGINTIISGIIFLAYERNTNQ